VTVLPLGLGHGILFQVNQQHVFHLSASTSESSGRVQIDTPSPKYLQSGMSADATTAVEEVYRSDWGRIVATLIRLVGDFDLAEEAAQEAFVAAVDQWRASGIPESPRAWIIQTARHKGIDRIRPRARFADKLGSYAGSELGPP